MSKNQYTRIEHDAMGPMEVPAEAYYGASTMRASLNFPISGIRFPRSFIRGLGLVKQSAAKSNMELGILDKRLGAAIMQAADEVSEGKLDDQFIVDIYQTGSGTSTNMNANEVIANRATEILGEPKGTRVVHPNDHVNLCQSSNDVIPTTIHLVALMDIEQKLSPALNELYKALSGKSKEFWPVIKTGRTHLQDATPIRLGQEFHGYSGQIQRGLRRLDHVFTELSEVALGGTAVGTGINAHPDFAGNVCAILSQKTGIAIHETDNHFQAQGSMDAAIETSAVLRTIAISLMKIGNDIRWMGCGPRAGLRELSIPEVQPGSSIMPGKVNPVIVEALIQACAQVQGNDLAISVGGQWGYLELNTMMPLIGYNLLHSITLLSRSVDNFTQQCVLGLKATENGPELVERGLALATALVPAVGYDAAAQIAKAAAKSGRTVREVARDMTKLSEQELDRILDSTNMTKPGYTGIGAGG